MINKDFDIFVEKKIVKFSKEYKLYFSIIHNNKIGLYKGLNMDYIFKSDEELISLEMKLEIKGLILSMVSTFPHLIF